MRYKIFNLDKKLNILINRIRKIISYIILIFLIAVAVSLYRNIEKLEKGRERIKKAEDILDQLNVENKKLEEKVKYAQSEEYIEKQIRDNLNMSKEGEIVIIMPSDDIVKSYVAKDEEVEKNKGENIGHWKEWLKLFGF